MQIKPIFIWKDVHQALLWWEAQENLQMAYDLQKS